MDDAEPGERAGPGPDTGSGPPPGPAPRLPAPPWLRWFREVGAVLVLVAVVEYLLVPKVVAARAELSLLRELTWWLLIVGVVLEAASLAAYTRATQVILTPAKALRFSVQLRIDLTGFGVSHVVPGGGATAAALRYGLMVGRGVDSDSALSLAAVQTVVSAVALLAVTALAGLASVPRTGLTTATIVLCALTLLALLGLLWVRRSRPGAAGRLRFEEWLPRRWAETMTRLVANVTRQLGQGGVRRQAFGWLAANWVLDAACLWVCLWAYGVVISPELVLAAYGVANLVGAIPVTPGGLGLIEGVLVPALLIAGGASGPTLFAVLTWRLLQYWLPIPVAALCWLSLQVRQPRTPS